VPSTNGAAELRLTGNGSSHDLYLEADGVWREPYRSPSSDRLELLFLRDS